MCVGVAVQPPLLTGKVVQTPVITPDLMAHVRNQFRLDWQGIHGAPHWSRVQHHGVALAIAANVDVRIPVLFSVLHDSQRENDGRDPGHGERAADYAHSLHRLGYFELPPISLHHLLEACRGHSRGNTDAPIEVQVCWDADRLDLGRVGSRPDPARLCTLHAKREDVIERAWRWSQGGPRPS